MSHRSRMLKWVASLVAGAIGATVGWLAGDVLVAAVTRGDIGDSAVGVMLAVGVTLTGTAIGAIVGLVSVGALLSGEETQ